ncbi:DUF6791 domain-containing protein [Niabella drilacis]|uniref:DUF6791 domain-containing protein n=1 Tax=Niabella drilacis (strain DSM 25811 / CCM 8410 / CCUG 62505 / LMG 26954 / E90) TaxID=1285928 RepID=A0A1G6XJS9_NIADE|nr:DUF6791 domain-containing protein [Niabella drilacis]SDD77446.1 hypothetical protein SAMN04487894_11373 [Niabella drilacis]
MQQQLINLNPDLKQLWDEGYDLEICGGHLLVHRIPFVNSDKQIKYGIFVCALTLASSTRVGRPQDHTVYFCGETPCNINGVPLTAIINNSTTQRLTETITVNHYFSSKPPSGYYNNYYDKIRTYAEILSAQAKSIDGGVTARPKRIKAA